MIRDRWVINNLPLRSILKRRSFRRIIWGSAISDTAFTTDLSTRLASYLYTFNHLLYTIYVYTIIFPDHGYLTSARAGTCAIPLVADARSLRIGPTSVTARDRTREPPASRPEYQRLKCPTRRARSRTTFQRTEQLLLSPGV